MPKIKVLLADDHTLFRQGISGLLSRDSDIEIICEVSNGGDALDKCIELRPDLLLIDISMPGLSSFEATRQLKKARPGTKVVFLSMYDDEDYLHDAVESGASGYILKDTAAPELMTAIREVMRGGTYLSPRLMARLVDDFRGRVKSPTRVSRFGTLTSREREVLKLLAEGKSVKDIAANLDLSTKTVEAHKFNLMRKLDIHNKAQLVHYAIQKKLIRVTTPAQESSVGHAADGSSDRFEEG
jgi:two-component system, NarL family, response regulator NreC